MSVVGQDVYRPVLAAASEHLVAALGRARFRQWFRDAVVQAVDARAVRLGVPTEVHRTWLEAVYGPALTDAFARVLGEGTRVEVVVDPRLDAARVVRDALPADEREWQRSLADSRPEPSFLSFVPEEGHRFALGLLEQVMHGGPDLAPRSIHLFGEAGAGKTHLLRALEGALVARRPGAAAYLPARDYTRRVVHAVRSGEPGAEAAVEEELLGRACVLIDGVDDLAPRPRTQRALESLLDAGAARGVRFVLAARQAPQGLLGLSDRLRSRLLSGVVVRVPAPGREALGRILAARARSWGVAWEPAVGDEILAKSASTAGACELLDRWALVSARRDTPVPADWLGEIATPASPTSPREEVVRRAKHVVADHFGVARRALDRPTKHPSRVFPRQVAMYLVWRTAALPLEAVARAFGLKSHSAASRAIQEVRARRDADPSVETLLDGLLARI